MADDLTYEALDAKLREMRLRSRLLRDHVCDDVKVGDVVEVARAIHTAALAHFREDGPSITHLIEALADQETPLIDHPAVRALALGPSAPESLIEAIAERRRRSFAVIDGGADA